jgi:methylenetetrahydrofolate dehydrogenase (NADP+)/methenyltetrahydrofolate cyclohydrolase
MAVTHAILLDGKSLAQSLHAKLKDEIVALKKTSSLHVGLGAILDPRYAPSKIYVGMKEKACAELGIVSKIVPVKADRKMILDQVAAFNADSKIHGILVQLPLPKGIDADEIIAAVDPAKDADGLHPYNMGKLLRGEKTIEPCTPAGVMRLIDSVNYSLAGKVAVVLGRSNIVGKPIGQLLLNRDATVIQCHSKTIGLEGYVRQADVVIAAVGKPEIVRGEWIKPGALVIDVGINRLANGKLVGDVEFAVASQRAAYITPVPGGVGPMTVAMLMVNTVGLAKKAMKF